MKNLLFILLFTPFISFAQSDSLTVGCIAKDTTMQLYTAKSGAKFFVFYSPAKKKYYKVFVPRIKD